MIDKKFPAAYTREQVMEIAQNAARIAVEQMLSPPNLDNGISQDVIANGGETMPSNHKERYYFVNKDGSCESKLFYGISKHDTDAKFQAFLLDMTKQESTAPLLKDFVENTYRKSFMRKLSPTSVTSYNYYLDRFILPLLGDKHMDEIDVTDVQRLYDFMASAKDHGFQKNIVADTIKRASGLLGRLYHIAIDMDLVARSPIKKTLLSNDGEASTHHEALPDAEVARIKKEIPNLENEQQRLYMALLVYTGMRREEIAGIGWEHLHLDDGYGSVQRTVVYPDGKRAIVRNKTKTIHSTRDFIIPDELDAILRPLARDKGFVIHGRDPDEPAPPSTIKRIYRQAAKILKISNYSSHDWRATFGTQLKESGLTSAQVADLMGHADTRMVETTYAPARHEGIMKHKNTVNNLGKLSEQVPTSALENP